MRIGDERWTMQFIIEALQSRYVRTLDGHGRGDLRVYMYHPLRPLSAAFGKEVARHDRCIRRKPERSTFWMAVNWLSLGGC